MKVVCVIPAYNEEKNIGQVIDSVKEFVDDVVVVDDGSSDNTSKIVSENGATLLRHLINRGQGAALQTGNEYALAHSADIVVHFDADGQFSAAEIEEMIKPIVAEGYDVVLGSRFLGKKTNMPFLKRYLIIPLARLINFLLFAVNLSDPQSGFRALNKQAIRKITIEQSGWAHCSEILGKVKTNKLKVKEVPITVTYSKFGRNLGSGLEIIKDSIIGKLIN